MNKAAFFIVVVMAAAGAHADPCTTQKNTIEINECGRLTLAKKDKELNVAFQRLLKSLSFQEEGDVTDYEKVRFALREAQRNWVKYRDSDCSGKLALAGTATMRGAIYNGCLIEHTEQRTGELNKWAEN
ncbi:MAG: hypothetical protein B7Z35_04040 [Hydrogenophilales bacterium 12-61-10]|nr:MAG: hypothetical protein B7Z35_04040 [Hydrogenophilales bacterium 12-61-10]OYX32193.1 MAG: hypothetical protein B7Z03_02710 [Hydrogenophilales bacterium 32-62-9]